MAYCGPSCAVPSLTSTPPAGFGSAGARDLSYTGLGYGAGAVAESSGNLGTLTGVMPQPINQIPASQVIIMPSPVVVTIPGPFLSTTYEPIAVEGNTQSATGGIRHLAAGYLGGQLGVSVPVAASSAVLATSSVK